MMAQIISFEDQVILLYKGKMIFTAKGKLAEERVKLWADLHGYEYA